MLSNNCQVGYPLNWKWLISFFEERNKPFFRPIYHLNSKELEETKKQRLQYLENAALNSITRLMDFPSFCTKKDEILKMMDVHPPLDIQTMRT
jgi:hypothetical protein